MVLDTRRDVTVIIDRTIPVRRTGSGIIVQGSVLASVPDIDHTGITQEVVTATTVMDDLVLDLAADSRGFGTSTFSVGVQYGLDETEWVSNSRRGRDDKPRLLSFFRFSIVCRSFRHLQLAHLAIEVGPVESK